MIDKADSAQKAITCWRPPAGRLIKINVDVEVRRDKEYTGVREVARDENGVVLGAFFNLVLALSVHVAGDWQYAKGQG